VILVFPKVLVLVVVIGWKGGFLVSLSKAILVVMNRLHYYKDVKPTPYIFKHFILPFLVKM